MSVELKQWAVQMATMHPNAGSMSCADILEFSEKYYEFVKDAS